MTGVGPGSLARWGRLAAAAALLALAAPARGADEDALGSIRGVVVRTDGSAVSGAEVAIDGLGRAAVVTDDRGGFAIYRLPPGSYDVAFSQYGDTAVEEGVVVSSGAATEIVKEVDWIYLVAESVTVFSASRRRERIVEAPAAVTSITEPQIERQAGAGQLPKILESAPGAEIGQSGLFDFKVNVRGVNGTVNRRVAVLIDGRNPAFPINGAQEWAAVGFPVDDLASAELIRGPSSALYGANAFNGTLNLVTKAPRFSQGGVVRFAFGDLATRRVDARVATRLAENWYFKGTGSAHRSSDFSRSRDRTLEYSEPCTGAVGLDCLFLEAVPLALDEDKISFAGARVDRDTDRGLLLTLEGGSAQIEGPVFTTSIGRFQLIDVRRPWARASASGDRWNLLGTYTKRDAEALTLGPGTPSFSEGSRTSIEGQVNQGFADGKGRVVVGGFYSEEKSNSTDPAGNETLLREPTGADLKALFAQADYQVNDRLKLVLAGRWDDNTLHPSQFSPKLALVYAATPLHVLRATYNEGFLAPNYPEYSLVAPLAPPIDLSAFEAFCAPSGVDCGFGEPTPLLAIGNRNLDVEKIKAVELGYKGILGRALFTADYYRTEMRDFVQVIIPQIGTRLGRVNPDFGPYAPPAGLPPEVAAELIAQLEAALGDLAVFLTNDIDGRPIFLLRSNTNFGRVETQGVELGLDYQLDGGWTLEANYSWFDHVVKDELESAPLGANAPEHKVNVGFSYVSERLSASVGYRWSDAFFWQEGVINGVVPSYGVLNVAGVYDLSDSWELGLNVSNLLDEKHYEFFSGDLMGIRAMAHLAYRFRTGAGDR